MQLVVVELCASRIVLLPAAAGPLPADAPIINAVRTISEPRTFPSPVTRAEQHNGLIAATKCTKLRARHRCASQSGTAASLTRGRSRQFRQGFALCREDVVAHRRGFALHFLEPVLDHVADRNHSDQTALLDDWDMAELALGHALHDAADGVVLVARFNPTGHRLADRLVECSRTARRQRLHNVALRYHADETAVGAEDKHRADPPFGKQLCSSGQACSRLNSKNLTTFLTEDSADGHHRLPCLHCLIRRHMAGSSKGNTINVRVGAEFRPAGLHSALRCSIEPGGGA